MAEKNLCCGALKEEGLFLRNAATVCMKGRVTIEGTQFVDCHCKIVQYCVRECVYCKERDRLHVKRNPLKREKPDKCAH